MKTAIVRKVGYLLCFLVSVISFNTYAQLAPTSPFSASPTTQPNIPNPNNNTSSIISAINNLVAGYGVNQLQPSSQQQSTALYFQSSDAAYNELVGNVINTILGLAPPQESQTLTGKALYQLFTVTNTSTIIQQLLDVPISNAPMPSASGQNNPNIYGGQTQQQKTSTSSFDLNSLLVPLKYTSDQQQSAEQFILYITGLATPTAVLDFSTLPPDQLSIALAKPNVQEYLVNLRAYVASASVAITNFYKLYNERLPVNIGNLSSTAAAVAQQTKLYPEASRLQVLDYLATRRYTDQSWINLIQNQASPAELQRQTIYLLRDMNYQLYQNRMLQERILATLSVIELQNAQNILGNATSLRDEIVNQPPFKITPPLPTMSPGQ